MNIKDYTIIEGHSNENTTAKIQAKLLEGWQPYGSPIGRLRDGKTIAIFQAMVKYELRKMATK